MQGIAMRVMAEPGKYSLQQLQQAVQSGSLPAYIGIPLIQEKIKQQKEMQGAGQEQAPQGPSIAEQVMQEAQGVESLPTNLPQQYAGGGIVAFDEGGEVEHYQNTGLVQPPGETPEERRLREFYNTPAGRAAQTRQDRAVAALGVAGIGDTLFAGPYNLLAGRISRQANALGVPRIGRALGIYPPEVTSVEIPRIGSGSFFPFVDKLVDYARQPTAADLGPVPGTDGATPILGGIADARTGYKTPAGAATPTTVLADSTAKASGPATGQGLKSSATGTGLKPSADRGLPALVAPEGPSYEQGARNFYDDYRVQARNMDVQAEHKKAVARGKVQGEAFDEYRKSLEDEAKEAGADKEQAKYMSIFKAGLAMMAGTSQHALENIGKGAMVGTEDYQAAAKELKKAERERRKEFAHIEQARRAEKIGDRDTAVREIDAARDREDARVRYTGEAIHRATQLDKAQSLDLAKTNFNAKTEIFKTDLAGQYTLAAAKERAKDSGTRGAFTQAQLARLRMDAAKQVDENAIRAQVAKRLGLSRTPPPGADAQFDSQTRIAFDSAVNAIIDRALGTSGGGGAGNSYQGYRLVPD